MELNNIEQVHLVGIGGINVSAIAQLLASKGIIVAGSDVAESSITDMVREKGITMYLGHSAEHVDKKTDLLVYSEAIPNDNPERLAAAHLEIPQMSAFQFWGEYAKGKKVIAVSGTNGKSTTTAMLGHILVNAGLDPTVVVGTKVLAWHSNIRIGSSDWLVIEADEYHGHMHEFKPYIAVVTNLALDHLDYYRDADDIKTQFEQWLSSVDPEGFIILHRDDAMLSELAIAHKNIRVFGVKGDKGVRSSGDIALYEKQGIMGENSFNIVDDDKDWGYVSLKYPGRHNIQNALAAAVAADCAGVRRPKITKALTSFDGTWRRFEYVGVYNGAFVISDYAHHPDGIRATIDAARKWYGEHMDIIAVFQPHQHNRTKMLFDDFAAAFDRANRLVLLEIYDVAGREEAHDQDVTSKKLAEAVRDHCVAEPATLREDAVEYEPTLTDAEKRAKELARKDAVILVMGAGDVDQVARRLVL